MISSLEFLWGAIESRFLADFWLQFEFLRSIEILLGKDGFPSKTKVRLLDL